MSFFKANIDNINLIIRSELIVFTHHFLIFFLKSTLQKYFWQANCYQKEDSSKKDFSSKSCFKKTLKRTNQI